MANSIAVRNIFTTEGSEEYGRVAAAVFPEHLGQHIQAGRLVGANPQCAPWGTAVVGYCDQRFVTQVLHALRVFEKHLPSRGQFYCLARAIEQTVAILLLQLADLGADCRLRAEYLFSSTREAALPGNFQERDELIEIHRLVRDYNGVGEAGGKYAQPAVVPPALKFAFPASKF